MLALDDGGHLDLVVAADEELGEARGEGDLARRGQARRRRRSCSARRCGPRRSGRGTSWRRTRRRSSSSRRRRGRRSRSSAAPEGRQGRAVRPAGRRACRFSSALPMPGGLEGLGERAGRDRPAARGGSGRGRAVSWSRPACPACRRRPARRPWRPGRPSAWSTLLGRQRLAVVGCVLELADAPALDGAWRRWRWACRAASAVRAAKTSSQLCPSMTWTSKPKASSLAASTSADCCGET